jgi:hypothetical protein
MLHRSIYYFIEKEACKLVFFERKTPIRTVIINATASPTFGLPKRSGSTEHYQQEAFRVTNRKYQGLTKLREKNKQERVIFLKARLRKTKPELSTFNIESMINGLGELIKAAQHRTRRFLLPGYEGDRLAHTPLKMDGKWWAWNLALAALPALLLMIVFEYHIPEYEAFFAEVNRQQKDRLMEAMGYKEEQDSFLPKTEHECDEIIPHLLDDKKKQDVFQRIERLERLLDDKRKQNALLRYELERLDQSGIQNRIEDRMIEKIAKERAEENVQQNENDMSNHTSMTGRLISLYNRLSKEGMIIINDLRLLLNYTFKDGVSFNGLDIEELNTDKSEDVPLERDEKDINIISENAKDKKTKDLRFATLVAWLSSYFSRRAK